MYHLNFEAAKLATECATEFSKKTPKKPRFICGILGPTNRTASLSPDVNDPGFRNTNFDDLVHTYRIATEGLIDGGSDLLMIETVFALLLILNGEIIEHTYKEKLSACMKSARIA